MDERKLRGRGGRRGGLACPVPGLWVRGLLEASEGLLGCLSGASSRPLGGLLGALGKSLGASWGFLGGLLSLWGLSRGPLGGSWAHLGMEGSKRPFAFPLLGPSWDLTLLASFLLACKRQKGQS